MNRYCPGSRLLKDPTPENYPCPKCGEEVEIWTHEVMAPCPRCHTPVFREHRPSCVDWCRHAEECVGPELYARFQKDKPQAARTPAQDPIDALAQDHEGAEGRLALLDEVARTAGQAGAPRAAQCIEEVRAFFLGELKAHFQCEEEALFPLLARHFRKDRGPIDVLLEEHRSFWQRVDELQADSQGAAAARLAGEIAAFLRGHIKRETTGLFPIARVALTAQEKAQVLEVWKAGHPARI